MYLNFVFLDQFLFELSWKHTHTHKHTQTHTQYSIVENTTITREGFLRKNIVAVSFFQNCAIHQYS